MSSAMSQADLDTLLGTLHPAPQAGAVAHAAAPSGRYDFSHPELLSRDQIRTLRTVHEGFAQALAKKLSTELLSNLSASITSIDQLTYAEFLMLVPTPTVLAVIEAAELDGKIAIELHPSIAFTFIDRLLGGSGLSIPQVRPLTVIEQGLMERILAKCCAELDAVWSPIFPLSFQLQSIEANPELARVVEPNEMVVVIAFEIRMNDVSGKLNLCLPYVVMEPALNRLSQGVASPRAGARVPLQARKALEHSLEACPVSVDVDLAHVDVSFRELLDLQSGDVLTFSPLSESGASASLQGVARLEGKPGRSRGQWAFQVVSKLLDGARAEGNAA